MDSNVESLMIQTFRAQIEYSRQYLPKLAEELNAASTEVERVRLAALYNEALKDAESLELQLASFQQRERERVGRWAEGPSTPD